jgi:hypothetical protein
MNSFLYLDEYEMYSLSAQIFGGLTESVVEFSEKGRSDNESQKGPVGSGRLMADIASEHSGKQERKFLQDYAYTLFEKRLTEVGKLLDLSQTLPASFRADIQGTSLLKVTGQALFTDVHLLTNLMTEFNNIGEALTYITNFKQLSDLKETLEARINATADRNQKAALREQIKTMADIKGLAKTAGLHQDPTFLKHLSYLVTYMMKDAFDVRVSLSGPHDEEICFISPLSRESLREPCDAIIRKYSRRCEEPLTVVGIVTQGKGKKAATSEPSSINDEEKQKNFGAALLEMANATATIEDSFFGRLDKEYVIDPIAVFRQL